MSVAVLKEQHVVFEKGFGYADIENQIPATENTPYYRIIDKAIRRDCVDVPG